VSTDQERLDAIRTRFGAVGLREGIYTGRAPDVIAFRNHAYEDIAFLLDYITDLEIYIDYKENR
jgi:hypothetical protein